MRAAGAVTAVLLAAALGAVGAAADMKAVFAFNDRLISATMPRLDYRIMTSVDENGRYVLIRTPAPGSGAEGPSFQIEIELEKLPPNSAPSDYLARAIATFVARLGMDSEALPPGKLEGARLAGGQDLQVAWNDSELRAHKGILLAAVDDGIGILVLLDVLEPDYDAAETVSLAILESLRVE